MPPVSMSDSDQILQRLQRLIRIRQALQQAEKQLLEALFQDSSLKPNITFGDNGEIFVQLTESRETLSLSEALQQLGMDNQLDGPQKATSKKPSAQEEREAQPGPQTPAAPTAGSAETPQEAGSGEPDQPTSEPHPEEKQQESLEGQQEGGEEELETAVAEGLELPSIEPESPAEEKSEPTAPSQAQSEEGKTGAAESQDSPAPTQPEGGEEEDMEELPGLPSLEEEEEKKDTDVQTPEDLGEARAETAPREEPPETEGVDEIMDNFPSVEEVELADEEADEVEEIEWEESPDPPADGEAPMQTTEELDSVEDVQEIEAEEDVPHTEQEEVPEEIQTAPDEVDLQELEERFQAPEAAEGAAAIKELTEKGSEKLRVPDGQKRENPFREHSEDPEVRARRHARTLASDILAYREDTDHRKALKEGPEELRSVFGDDLQQAHEEYVQQVDPEKVSNWEEIFVEAVNEIIGNGQPVLALEE